MTPPTPGGRATGTDKTAKMRTGRQADSARRRTRVTTAIDQATHTGAEISVSSIARAATVDRAFLYRHHDLLERIHTLQTAPPASEHAHRATVTNASLQADLLAAHERAARLTTRIRQLEHRLSEALGERTWREAGLAAPDDTTTISDKLAQAEQQTADLRIQLSERDDELAAARTVNRELLTRLNHNDGPT